MKKKKAKPKYKVKRAADGTQTRNKLGRFVAGGIGISPGRPVLNKTSFDRLLQAVSRVESKKNKNLVDYYIERAYKSDPILVSVMKKLYPDLQAIAQMNFDQQMDDATAESIRKALIERAGVAEQPQ